MMEATCFHCANILGCPMLSDSKGVFILERVITSEKYRKCPDWGPIQTMQREVRKTLMGLQGDNVFRILHQVGTIINQGEESADEMIDDMPDFAGMFRKGMMSADREEQLRYETDEHGNVVLEELGHNETLKRPRPTYQLRKFACDPEGYIQLDHSAGIFQTQDWLIKFILKIEIEKGLIIRSKRTKTMAPKPETKPEETEDMAAGRKVLTRRGKGDAAKGPKGPKVGGGKGGRVGKPPRKTATTARSEEDGGSEAPEGLPDAPALDIEAFSEDLQVKVGETVTRLVTEKFNEITAQLEDLQARSQELMDGLTIFHDFMIQTSGTMQYEEDGETQPLPEMFDHERKILGHLEEEGDPS